MCKSYFLMKIPNKNDGDNYVHKMIKCPQLKILDV